MSKNEGASIRCVGPFCRGLMNIFIVGMPFWVFLLPYIGHGAMAYSSDMYKVLGVAPEYQLLFMTIFWPLVFFRFAFSRVLVKGKEIFFPLSLTGQRVDTLKKISLYPEGEGESKFLNFEFGTASGGVREVRVSLAPMSHEAGRRFVAAVEKVAPSCRITLAVREHFASAESFISKQAEEFVLVYHGSNWLQSSKAALASKGRILSRMWIGAWAITGVVNIPFIVSGCAGAVAQWFGETKGYEHPFWAYKFAQSYSDTFMKGFLDVFVSKPFQGYSEFVRDSKGGIGPIIVCVFLLVVFAMVFAAARQPNRLRVSRKSLLLYANLMGLKMGNRSLDWDQVAVVDLHKPSAHGSLAGWEIRFHTLKSKKPALTLRFDAFKTAQEQRALLEAIETHAPAAHIDPALVEIFRAQQARSYTELWLQSLSSPPKRERLSPLEGGHILHDGRYQIVEQLAVGGQGTAYTATDRQSKSDGIIVLKEFVLPVYVEKDVRRQALERFQREAQTLDNLQHDQIVNLLDYFVEDHRAYLVLEHVEGRTLRQLVEQDGPASSELALDLVEQMCTILQYLHGLHPALVHRDFTPDNLILGSNGSLKLIDFDVARRDASQAKTTVVGKHSYIPPEQFRGKPTTQSDIYAMGATVFYLLTGEDPEPLSRSSLLSGDWGGLDELVEKATELDTEQRFRTVQEVMLYLTERKLKTLTKDEEAPPEVISLMEEDELVPQHIIDS